MKNLFLGTAILISFSIVSQAQDDSKDKLDFYLAAGLSISNSFDNGFAFSSYPSIEFGAMKNNFSLGLVVGRANFSGFDTDDISNYWYELKTAISFPIGNFSGYGVLGIGNYIATDQFFIEFGAGFMYSFNKISVFAQASNWDGTWYATPGISYTF